MPCYAVDDVVPVVHPDAFVHPEAVLIGDVLVAAGCYIGPFASLRADFGRVEIGKGTNIQDGCTVHCFPGADTVVGTDGHVGHGAILHGCTLGEGVLIGMNSVVMDGAVIGDFAFIGASSLVPTGMQVPAGSLAVGCPATVRRTLTDKELAWKANGTRLYQELAQRSRATMVRVAPRTEAEPDRRRVSTGTDAAVPLPEYRRRACP